MQPTHSDRTAIFLTCPHLARRPNGKRRASRKRSRRRRGAMGCHGCALSPTYATHSCLTSSAYRCHHRVQPRPGPVRKSQCRYPRTTGAPRMVRPCWEHPMQQAAEMQQVANCKPRCRMTGHIIYEVPSSVSCLDLQDAAIPNSYLYSRPTVERIAPLRQRRRG